MRAMLHLLQASFVPCGPGCFVLCLCKLVLRPLKLYTLIWSPAFSTKAGVTMAAEMEKPALLIEMAAKAQDACGVVAPV